MNEAKRDHGGDFLMLRNEAARARTASDMVLAGDFAFVAGILPIDLNDDRKPLSEYIEEQTEQCLANLETIIARAGLARDNRIRSRRPPLKCLMYFAAVIRRYAPF